MGYKEKREPCTAVHPKYRTQCWSKKTKDPHVHWYEFLMGGRLRRTEWTDA